MIPRAIWLVVLAVVPVVPALADYDAGRRAWDAVAEALGKNWRDGAFRLGGGCWIVTAEAP